MTLARDWRDLEPAAIGKNGEDRTFKPLTIRTPREILEMRFDPNDRLLANGYLTKGNSLALVGAGGIGKSRVVMQMAIACILGNAFLGWETNARGQKWLILQTENSNRRLQTDLSRILKRSTPSELLTLDQNLRIHTLENDDDTLVGLSNPETDLRIREILKSFPANVIVFDVLRDFAAGDLNADQHMTETCRAIGRITRAGDPSRIALVVHHSLTGKVGAARATGFDRGSFGRNSKVFQGWVRAQINLAPYSAESNDVLVVASGKANDATEFEPFTVRLDPETMTYQRDDSNDLAQWYESVSGEKPRGAVATISDVVDAVRAAGSEGINKVAIVKAITMETGCSKATAYRVVNTAESKKLIARRKNDKRYEVTT
jgi:AAA domain